MVRKALDNKKESCKSAKIPPIGMHTSTFSTRQNLATISESTFTLPNPQVRLRPLLEKDLLALEWHGGADLRSFYQREWKEHQAGQVLVIVADFNDFPIAQVAIHWLGKSTRPGIPDIQSFRVMDVFQRQGIGSRLLKTCESAVATEGHSQIGLAVGLENTKARRLYERLKYRIIGKPYEDKWSYVDTKGNTVKMSELVTDMIKDL